MDLIQIVENEFTQPLREAIANDDLIATRKLINSISQIKTESNGQITIDVFAESYILNLRDGTQYENNLSLSDIETWIEAKGLTGSLDAGAVYNSILTNGTIWDRQGGVQGLKNIINKINVQRVMDILISEAKNQILK